VWAAWKGLVLLNLYEIGTELEEKIRPDIMLLHTLSLIFEGKNHLELDVNQCVEVENAILRLSANYLTFERRFNQYYDMVK